MPDPAQENTVRQRVSLKEIGASLFHGAKRVFQIINAKRRSSPKLFAALTLLTIAVAATGTIYYIRRPAVTQPGTPPTSRFGGVGQGSIGTGGAPQAVFEPSFSFGYTKLLVLNVYEEPKVDINTDLKNWSATFTLYQADLDSLLNYFTYTQKEESGHKTSQYDYPLDRSALTKIASWEEKGSEKITLPIKEMGIYFLEAKGSGLDYNNAPTIKNTDAFLVVNGTGLVEVEGDAKMVFWAQDLKTTESVASLPIEFYQLKDAPKVVDNLKTDKSGLAETENDDRYDLAVAQLNNSNDTLVVPIYLPDQNFRFRGYFGGNDKYKTFFFTDRPIYKPGDTVFYKGIVRLDNDAVYKNVNNATGKISYYCNWEDEQNDQPFYTDDFIFSGTGSFSGELTLDSDLPPVTPYARLTIGGEDTGYFSPFRVAHYRKPEYELTIETSELEYVSQDKIQATVAGKYYSGLPLAGRKISYTVGRSDFYPYRQMSQDEVKTQAAWGYYSEEFQAKKEVLLNASGQATVEINADLRSLDKSQILTIEVLMEDGLTEIASDVKRVVVYQGEFSIFRKDSSYSFSLSKPVEISLEAVENLTQKPVPNQAVNAEIKKVDWLPVNNGQYKSYEKSEKTVKKLNLRTDRNGAAKIRYDPSEDGSYTIYLTATDKKGNSVTQQIGFWVSPQKILPNLEGAVTLSLTPDKNKYALNDTVNLSFESNFGAKEVLFTLARRQIYEYQVVSITNGVGKISLKADNRFVPNIYAQAMSFAGRGFISTSVSLEVPAEHKKINLSLTTDKKTYLPGEKATLTIATKDNEGKALPSEVAVGVVDKAIYALAEDIRDIYETFYQKRWQTPYVNHSFEGISGYGGEGGGGGGGVPREKFLDTAYWNPNIQTDKNGGAKVTFTLPDDLTTWVISGFANTEELQVGQSVAEFAVQKPIFISPILPNYLNFGDTLKLGANIQNFSGQTKNLTVEVEVTGAKLKSATSQNLTLKDRELATRYFEIEAPATEGKVKIELAAYDENEKGDRVIKTLPVQPYGFKLASGQSGEGEKEISLALANGSLPNRAKISLSYSPTLLGSIPETLTYLAGYPYGCTEQVVSRFLPALIAYENYDTLGIKKPEFFEDLPEMVKKAIKQLGNTQNWDGSWGWWGNSSEINKDKDVFITAYATYALQKAKQLGFDVHGSTYKQAKNYLESTDIAGGSFQTKSFQAYVLARLASNKAKDFAAKINQNQATPTTLAYLALAFDTISEDGLAQAALNLLKQKAQTSGGLTFWQTTAGDKQYFGSDHSATALALRALLAIEPNSPLVTTAAQWLGGSKNGNYWSSTFSSFNVIEALIDFAEKTSETSASYTYKISLGGEVLAQGEVKSNDFKAYPKEITIDPDDIANGATLKIEKSGTGQLYWNLAKEEFISLYNCKNCDTSAAANGMTLQRSFSGESGGGQGSFRVGELVKVKVNLQTSFSDARYLLIEDYLPAGLVPVDMTLANTPEAWRESQLKDSSYYNYWEVRKDRAILSTYSLDGKSATYIYFARAVAPGTFAASPSSAFLMYEPQLNGRSSSTKVTINE